MNAVLEQIHPDAATEVVDVASINDGQPLVRYSATELHLATLRSRYAGVQFDLTTVAGDKAARAARLELVTLRTALEKRRKEFKQPALEFGKLIDSEAARITVEIRKLADPIDAQIRADEERREREREAKRQAEAARVAKMEQELSAIRAFLVTAQRPGMTADRIANGMELLRGLQLDPEALADFYDRAVVAKDETLQGMAEIHAAATAREAELAALDAQRKENERIAAELAEQQRKLNEQAAELRRQQHECEAARQRAERPAPAATAAIMGSGDTPAPGQRETPQITHQDAQESGCSPADAPAAGTPASYASNAAESATAAPSGEQGPGAQADISAPEPATLKLGEVNARLGLTMTRDFIEHTLGVIPAGTDKRAVLFRPSQFSAICGELVSHVQAMSVLHGGDQ